MSGKRTPMTMSGWCESPAENTLNGLSSHEYCGTLKFSCSCECHREGNK